MLAVRFHDWLHRSVVGTLEPVAGFNFQYGAVESLPDGCPLDDRRPCRLRFFEGNACHVSVSFVVGCVVRRCFTPSAPGGLWRAHTSCTTSSSFCPVGPSGLRMTPLPFVIVVCRIPLSSNRQATDHHLPSSRVTSQ